MAKNECLTLSAMAKVRPKIDAESVRQFEALVRRMAGDLKIRRSAAPGVAVVAGLLTALLPGVKVTTWGVLGEGPRNIHLRHEPHRNWMMQRGPDGWLVSYEGKGWEPAGDDLEAVRYVAADVLRRWDE